MQLTHGTLYFARAVSYIHKRFMKSTTEMRKLQKGPEAGLLNKSSHLFPALDATKFVIVTDIFLVPLCCPA
jgi:hypothetical protein